MINIPVKLASIYNRIDLALKGTDRSRKDVILIAASKGQSSNAIRIAYDCGQRHFGENYLQEALRKQEELSDLSDICWHFIGPMQSNKTGKISNNFDWVHTIDRAKIAERLNISREDGKPPLNVCIQVNISEETTKSGVSVYECTEIANIVSTFPSLCLRGLMTMPKNNTTKEEYKEMCQTMSTILLKTKSEVSQLTTLDTLSMGMSSDFELAIKNGATMVRIGSAIFGPR